VLFTPKLSASMSHEFSHQLALLLNSNISLQKSLELLSEHRSEPKWQDLMQSLQKQLTEGYTLSEALRRFPEDFPAYYCSLIRCGETSSRLATVLEQLAQYQKLNLNFKKKLKRAISYPLFVLFFSLCTSLGIIVWVIPQFADLFQKAANQLPWITRVLINFSQKFSDLSPLIFLGLVNLSYITRWVYRSCFLVRWHSAKIILKVPIILNLIQLSELTRWLRLLSTQLKAGVTLFSALQASEVAFTHLYHKAGYQLLLTELHSGSSLNKALTESTIFPHGLIKLLSLGEHSGKLENLFDDAATLYEGRLENFLMNLTQWVEPLSLLLIATLTAMLIVALYLPIFQIGELL